jgi:hypothetical protein
MEKLMYDIYQYITDSKSMKALDEAFEGIRQDIRHLVKKNILSLGAKQKEEALEQFGKTIYMTPEYLELSIKLGQAKKQLKEEYNNDPLIDQLMDFELTNEIKKIFLEEWAFVPQKILRMGIQHRVQH